MKLHAGLLLVACATSMFALALPAGADPAVGHVAVSNASPARASTIAVASSGWRPGSVVSISLSGTLVARATVAASGAVRTDVSIPTDAPTSASLAVVGAAASGVPQQVVTNLAVVGTEHVPAPERPWPAICLVLAIATLLLLAGVRTERMRPGAIAAPG